MDISNNKSFKKFLIISFIIYMASIIFSLIITLILNYDFGEMNFNNDLGGWKNILLQNMKVSIFIILGGLFLSIPSLFLIVINGCIIGFTFGQSIINDEITQFLLTLAPHAIPEILSFIFAGAISLHITHSLYIQKKFDLALIKFLIVQIFFCALLCLLGAIIEGFD